MITDDQLRDIRDELLDNGLAPRSWLISKKVSEKFQETMDQSTIRGRFLAMGEPLSNYMSTKQVSAATTSEPIKTEEKPVVEKSVVVVVDKREEPAPEKKKTIIQEVADSGDSAFKIPDGSKFEGYIERNVDAELSRHYELGKHPLTQGKQGTGKTTAHEYYAFKKHLPFFLFSCHEDFRLHKLFGDKTIIDGSVKYQEGAFVKACQVPSVCVFDEINAVSNANSFDFHALLQNRELFVKDANDGRGKTYRLHPECRIGFAQNPRSNKYIGGTIKPSNFLGRCTFITFPEFTKAEMKKLMNKRYPNFTADLRDRVITTYMDLLDMIEKAQIPIDLSIRQLINLCDFIQAGMGIKTSWEQSIIFFLDAASQPNLKQSFVQCIGTNFPEVLNKKEKVETKTGSEVI